MRTHQEVWANCLRIIEDNVTDDIFNGLFAKIVPMKFDGQVLVIQVPSHFIYEYLEEHYLDLLKKTIHKEIGHDAKLEYSIMVAGTGSRPIPQQDNAVPRNKPMPFMAQPDTKKGFNPFIMPGLRNLEIDPQLNPHYSFENFIEGECNILGRSAGLSIAREPGHTAFNPLFIHGGTGLGKTHLAQAIGLETKRLNPNKVVLYVSAHKFQEQYTSAVQRNETNNFLHFYQMIDVLIIDDVHDFAGKTKTQDVFFHIFNHLQNSSKQLILTSDKAPVDIEGLEPRILSRFKWGLSAEIEAPHYETRLAIFRHKVYKDGIEISDDIIQYLAKNVTSNIREFEGVLTSLLAQATILKRPISMEMVVNVVNKSIRNTQKNITVDYIYKTVCEYFGVPNDNAQSKTRKREVVQARQISMYFSKQLTKASLASIGAQIGGKNHATVLHACKTVNNLIETDKQFSEIVANIEKKLTN